MKKNYNSLPQMWGSLFFVFFFAISSSFGQAFVENFDTNTGITSSVSKTLSGVQFDFVFTSDGDGGDFAWESKFGDGDSPSLNLQSTIPNLGTTERVTISRQDGNTFIFSGIYINNTGGELITVQGYNGVNTVGSPQTVANGADATLNFPNITVTEVRLTSTEFFTSNIDTFRGAIVTNSAPTATAPTISGVMEDVPYSIPDDIQVSDVDGDDQTVSFTITGGALTLGTTNITFGGSLNGSNSFTATGTLAAINTALDAAVFTPTLDLNGTDAGSISFSSFDGTVDSNVASVTFDIAAVNDDPTITGLPASITVEEDATTDPLDISAATISDVDAGSGSLTLKLLAVGGVFDYAAGTGISLSGQNSPEATFTGNLTDLNNYINIPTNIYFRPDANLSGNAAASVQVRINDNGNTGSNGGTDILITTIQINITPVNDAPTAILLDNLTVLENEPVGTTVGIFSATDPDIGDTFTYTLVLGTGADDNSSFSISGNELRTSQVFDFNNKNNYSIRVRVTDSGNLFLEEDFIITVDEVNEAPTDLLISNNSIAENSAIGTSVGTFSALDPNSGETFSYTLVSGEGDVDNGSFSISGDELQSAAIFDFETKNSYSVRVRVTDSGNLFFERQFTISVTNVNEAPTITSPPSIVVFEDEPQALTGISFSDLDAGSNAVTATFSVASGTLSATSGGGVTVGGTSIERTLSGAINDINTFISAGNLTFTTALNSTSDVTLTINISDNGNTGSGGNQTDLATLTLDITAVNDAPVNTVPGSQTINQDMDLIFSSENGNVISISDVDVGSGTLRIELSATNGRITLSTISGLTFETGTGTNDTGITMQGTLANINAALNGLIFRPNSGYIGTANLRITSSDQGNSGSGGALEDMDDISITVNLPAPVITGVTASSDDGLYKIEDQIFIVINFSQPLDVNTSGGTPTLTLETGLNDILASYLSGSGSTALVFTYTVEGGNVTANLDYTSTSSLTLNGGTIRNVENQDAILTLPSPGTAGSLGANKALVVDGIRPTASLLVSDTELILGETTTLTITFNEAVSGLEIADFTVANGSLSGLSSSDGGITWTATLTPDNGVENPSNVITLINTGYTDFAGNTGIGTTNSNNYAIDTQVPATPNAPDLESGSDSGVSDTDNITNVFTPTFSGVEETGSTISVTSNLDGTLGSATANGAGVWSFTPISNLSTGVHAITVTVIDLVGNSSSESVALNLVIDNSAPTADILPNLDLILNSDGNAFLDPNDIIISLVDDNSSVVDITIELNRDSFDCSDVGNNSITLTTVDQAGNSSSWSSTINVEDNTSPDVRGKDITVNVDAFGSYILFSTMIDDGSSDACGIAGSSVSPAIFTKDNAGVNNVTYTVTDINGNSNSVTVQVTVVVNPKVLDVVVDARQSKIYGDADPIFSYSATGFENGDNSSILTGSLERAGGEDVGSYKITLGTLDAGPNYTINLIEADFEITPATLSISSDAGQRKTYGDADPTFTYQVTGFKNGDEERIFTGVLFRRAGEDVGTYQFNLGSLSAGANYNLQLISTTPFLISPAPLRLIADDKQKIFNAANPPLTFTYDGLVNGDTQIQTEPIITTTATETSPVGNYSITLTGGSDPNYSITRVEGTLTIGQKAVTITANNQSKVYGQANPVLTFSYEGLLEGDTQIQTEPSISTEATISSNVGSYEITLSGGSDPNYDFTLVNGTLSVTPATLTITADDKSKVYGESNPPLTFSYAGLVNGDSGIAVEPSITSAASANSNVGTYDVTLTGGSDPNYAITRVNGTLTVTPADLTITADDQSKIYGAANPALTFTYSGLVNGDTQAATEPSISTTANSNSNVGIYPITLAGAADANYDITLVAGELEVTQAALTITADNKSKVYGESNPELTFTYSGLVNGDTQAATEPSISTTATANSNVGTYPITLTGSADANYDITLVEGELEVTQASLTITAEDKSKVYGQANPALTFTYLGLVNGDTQAATEPNISTTATTDSNVGTYPITLIGASDANYDITLVDGELEVSQAALTITADNQSKVYGEANPALTFTYSGLVNGDTQAATEPSISTAANTDSNVGTYPITLTGAADVNYNITLVDGELEVTQAALTITADDKSKVYGEANPALTFTYSGLLNGDTQAATEPSISTTATTNSNVGTYPITLTGAVDANYNITLVDGELDVTQAGLTITADDKSKVYGLSNPALTFTYSGLVNGDSQVTTEPSISTTANAGSNVGTYPITLTGAADANYDITLVAGELEVTQASLTITADGKSKVYGEINPALSFTYSGLVNGDTQAATEPSISTTVTTNSNVGAYAITLTGAADANYDINLIDGELEVTQASLTIIADDKSKVYGEDNPALTFTYSGLVNGDTQAATAPSISTTATTDSSVGTYPITLTGAADANYDITLVDGELEVTQATLTITSDDKSKVYGEANPTLTFTYSGLVNGDTQAATEPSISTTATANSNVGTYPITLTRAVDANYDITLVEGELEVTQATLTITANEGQSKVFGTADPVLSYSTTGFEAGDNEQILTGNLTRDAGEATGNYPINLGNVSAGGNYQIVFISTDFEIIPAVIEAVMQPAPVETIWGVNPDLPSTVTVMTTDGQFLELPITWDLQTLYIFGNGEYPLTATLNLPSGILNTDELTVEIVVTVLPKPAPEDITLDNNSFEAEPGQNFIAVGNLTVIDPIDNQHEISLADLAFDNVYFQINNGTLFWNSAERADGRTEFKVLVRVQDRDGNILEKEFDIIRNRTSVSNIEIFNSFTPNGDNVNDTWGVEELRFYKGVRIQIFERSGKRIFYTENPDVRWDGTSNSTDLPTGTYYWTVEVGETGEVRRGMLNLIRE